MNIISWSLLLLVLSFDNCIALQSLVKKTSILSTTIRTQNKETQWRMNNNQHKVYYPQSEKKSFTNFPYTTHSMILFSSSEINDNDNTIIDDNNNYNSSSSVTITAITRADRPLFIPEIPANLRRKLQIRRAPLGHVVPKNKVTYNKYGKRIQSGGSKGPQLRQQGVQRDVNTNSPNLLRISSGIVKGRKLVSPNVYLRPMMGKVREAVFSTFQSFGLYDPNICKTLYHLDIFSGSGSVGIESLSRGATFCTFIDLATDCCLCAKENLNTLGFSTSTSTTTGTSENQRKDYDEEEEQQQHQVLKGGLVIQSDAIQALQNPYSIGIPADIKYNLITICPPYEEIVYGDLLDAVAQSELITDDTIIMIEYPIELGCLPHVIATRNNGVMLGIRNRKYGRTVIAIYIVNPTGKLLDSAASRPEEFISLRR